MPAGFVAVLASDDDDLARAVIARLRTQRVGQIHLRPEELAATRMSVGAQGAWIDGQRLAGAFIRTRSGANLSTGFTASDRSFVDAEAAAMCLALMHAPGVVAVNAYDAAAWSDGGWLQWRGRIGRGLAPMTFGTRRRSGSWLPYGAPDLQPLPDASVIARLGAATCAGGRARCSRVLGGRIVAGPTSAQLARAARLLARQGIALGELWSDTLGRVVWIETQPRSWPRRTRQLAAEFVVTTFRAHRARW